MLDTVETLDAASLISDPQVFESMRLFTQVRRDDVEHYLRECSELRLTADDVLLSPTQTNFSFYLLVEGELQVRHEQACGTVIAHLGAGECVGELSLIEQRRPSAYVVAMTSCRLLVFRYDTLWAMLNASHAVARNLLAIISGRVRNQHKTIEDSSVISRHYYRQSITDSLTGLHNRRWLNEFFVREVKRCSLDSIALCLVIIDVDGFNVVNSRFGHLVGDHALGLVAERLKTHFRSDDLLVRVAGDEFAVLLPAIGAAEALDIAERVRASIEDERNCAIKVSDHGPKITASLGLAELKAGDDFEDLFLRADQALYRAKKAGGNRVCE